MNEFSVEEIIIGIKARDNCVLQHVYKNYYPTIQNFILNNSGSDDDAKDIFQEAIIVIYRKVKEDKRFLLNSSFKTFMYSIARHLWLKQLRSKKIEDEKISDQQNFIELKEEPFKINAEDLRMNLYRSTLRTFPKIVRIFLN